MDWARKVPPGHKLDFSLSPPFLDTCLTTFWTHLLGRPRTIKRPFFDHALGVGWGIRKPFFHNFPVFLAVAPGALVTLAKRSISGFGYLGSRILRGRNSETAGFGSKTARSGSGTDETGKNNKTTTEKQKNVKKNYQKL